MSEQTPGRYERGIYLTEMRDELDRLRDKYAEALAQRNDLLDALREIMKSPHRGGTIGEMHYHMDQKARLRAFTAIDEAEKG